MRLFNLNTISRNQNKSILFYSLIPLIQYILTKVTMLKVEVLETLCTWLAVVYFYSKVRSQAFCLLNVYYLAKVNFFQYFEFKEYYITYILQMYYK